MDDEALTMDNVTLFVPVLDALWKRQGTEHVATRHPQPRQISLLRQMRTCRKTHCQKCVLSGFAAVSLLFVPVPSGLGDV